MLIFLQSALRLAWLSWPSRMIRHLPDGLLASNPASDSTEVLAGRVYGVLSDAAARIVIRHTEPARLVGGVPAGVVVGLHDVGVEGVGLAELLNPGTVVSCRREADTGGKTPLRSFSLGYRLKLGLG